MSDIVERLRKAAADFEAMRSYSANALDSDCEPHWSDQADMADASKATTEAAAEIEALRAERDAIRKATIEECASYCESHSMGLPYGEKPTYAGYVSMPEDAREYRHVGAGYAAALRSLSSPEQQKRSGK